MCFLGGTGEAGVARGLHTHVALGTAGQAAFVAV